MGASAHGGGSFGSQGFGSGNSAFGRSQFGNPHTDSRNSSFGHTSGKKATSHTVARKAKKNAGTKKHIARGNSAFGHNQGDATTRTTGSQNSAFGQARAATAHGDATTSTVVGSDGATQTGPGNSDFGHRQGDAATRTTGSQNSAFGQARAAEAKAKPTPTPNQ